MKNIFFICFCALFAFSGCADDDDDLLTGGNVDIDLLPDAKPNDVVDPQVFEAINLNYPGLEKVKEFYEAGEHYYAANALLEYYRTRTNVTNPNLSLINVTISEAEQAKADYALVDYRFHVNNFYEDKETLKPYSVKQDLFRQIDYSLLFTFAGFFIFIGNLTQFDFLNIIRDSFFGSAAGTYFSALD